MKEIGRVTGPGTSPLESTEGVEDAFSVLHEMETTAGKLCEIYQRRDMEASISVGEEVEATIPLNLERVFRGKVRATLVEGSEFGLSLERPVWLALFSDALAIISLDKRTKQDARAAYDLIRWIPLDGLSVFAVPEITATNCHLRRKLFKLAFRAGNTNNTTITTTTINNNTNFSNANNSNNNIGTPIPQSSPGLLTNSNSSSNSGNNCVHLPPGWEVGAGKGKQKVYTYVPDGVSQGTAPRMAPELTKESLVAVPTEALGVWDEWVGRHMQPQTAGSAWDDRPDLYQQIGASLEALLDYEQAFYPGETTPLLFRILTNTILRKGLADEGIFRISWDTNENARLVSTVNSGRATGAGIKKPKAAKKHWWHGIADGDTQESGSANGGTTTIAASANANNSVGTSCWNANNSSSINASTGNNTNIGSSGSGNNNNNNNNNNSSSSVSGSNEEMDLGTCGSHVLANLLKAFFRCMPAPVIPPAFYRRFHALVAKDSSVGGGDNNNNNNNIINKSSNSDNDKEKVAAFKSLVEELPGPNYALLRDLIQFLHAVASNSKVNQMPARNLAIVFGVNIMWESEQSKARPMEIMESNKAIAFLIDHSTEVFGEYLNPGGVPTLAAFTTAAAATPFIQLRHKAITRRVPLVRLLPPLTQSPSDGPWTLSADGTLAAWSRSSFALTSEMPTTLAEPRAVACMGESIWATLPKGGIAVVSRTAAGAAPAVVPTPFPVACLAAVGDGTVWCGDEGGSVSILAAETFEKYGEIALNSQISAILPLKDTVWCALYRAGAPSQEIRVFDAMTSALIKSVATPGPARITAMARGAGAGADVVWTGDAAGQMCVWSANTCVRLATLHRHTAPITVLAAPARPDQMWSAAADGPLFVWMAAAPFSYIGELRGFHSAPITSVLGFDGGNEVWTASLDCSLCMWKVGPVPSVFTSLDNVRQ